MHVYGLLLVTALMVPPGKQPQNHNQPMHGGDIVIRRFERRDDDDARRRAWESYCRELDDLWLTYREAGSTPRAWAAYKEAAGDAKRSYVERDPYLVPIINP